MGVLRTLGKVGKGFATATGVAVTVVGVVVQSGVVDQIVIGGVDVGKAAVAAGALLAAFGVGRKAGAAAAK